MSGNTLSYGPDRWWRQRAALAALALLATMVLSMPRAFAGDAPPLPPQVVELAPNLKVQGGGELTFYGISVYDGYYWGPRRGWNQDVPYALDLHYHRALDGARIAERSVGEITKLGYGTPEQRARWGDAMAHLFPDVHDGDRLTGVNLPGGIVRYFHNGRLIGEIAEPGFAHAFFGIWLDPKSSQAEFRHMLLGDKP
jgi:Chalcone isomerase-like